mgnify:CR=1 FL=1
MFTPKTQTFLLICLLVLMIGNYFWPRDETTQTKLAIAHWPLSTKKHLQLAKVFFNNNYEKESIEEFKKGEKLYQFFSFLDFSKKTKKHLKEIETLIFSPQKIKEEVVYWETVLNIEPFYRDGFLQLAALNYQLGQAKKAQEYWKKAYYLDPNNLTVQELGKLVGVTSN